MIGQKLSHYRIVEQIGAGGMGVVYRAHDEQLDRDVAIKVIPPGSLADEAAHKRFRQEALSLARLNHPNVATVHEFGSQDGVDYLVTEYIAGATLDSKLGGGALPPKEVVRLGVQLAHGLAAAHAQGIIHRDLKPANLRLTPDGRLKILDFGLAQFAPQPSELGMTITMTTSQEVTGTLPYMSPEQLRGELADARADIWSAGAVLYEMATGKRPFPQASPPLVINAILNQEPDAPTTINAGVPPNLEVVIMKALDKNVAQRYQTASDLASDLELFSTPSGRTSAVVARTVVPVRKSPALVLSIAGIAIVLAAAGGYFFFHRPRHNATTVSTTPHRRAIAVLGFKNLSGNPEKSWLSTALSEMLTTELAQGDQLRTIPGESVAQMKINLSLPEADSFSQQTLNRIRQNLGSDDIVLGSYLPLGNGLMRLDLRLQDAVAGETLASVSEKGNETDIDDLVNKAGAELRAKLGISALSDVQSAAVKASLPATPEAARLYSLGLEKLRLFDALSAKNLLEKATALDPNHAPTHSALAAALTALGEDNNAKQQAKQALDLSAQFSREERLLIEGRSHELLGERTEAIDAYRALWEFFPDRVDYGLLLIHAQIAAGHGKDGEATLAALRKLPVSDIDAARVDLADANIAHSLSDFKREQAAAVKAEERGRSVGAGLLVAEALLQESAASERMGETKKTLQLTSDARDLYTAAGYRQAAARTLLLTGDVLFDQGDFEGARKKFDEALPVFREIGSQKSTRADVERIGNVLYGEGKLRESLTYYDQALKYDQTFHDPVGLAGDYGNIANDLDGLGDLNGSLKMQQQALAAFNETGDRRGASATLNNIGNVYVEMGNAADAKKNFEQALDLARQTAYHSGEPYPISGLGDVLLLQGDLAGARKPYEQALAMSKEMQIDDFTAQLNSAVAFIDLLEDKLSESEALLRQAIPIFEKSNAPGNNAWSHALLARVFLKRGNLVDARTAVNQALTLSRQVSWQTANYEAALADSRVKAKSSQAAAGRQELESMLISARKYGYRSYEYQARLAQIEIESYSSPSSASVHAATLERDARAQGLLLVANQAHALIHK